MLLLFGVIWSPNTLRSSSAKLDAGDDIDESPLQLSVSASDDKQPASTALIKQTLRKCIGNL